jgi:hypothetical protein
MSASFSGKLPPADFGPLPLPPEEGATPPQVPSVEARTVTAAKETLGGPKLPSEKTHTATKLPTTEVYRIDWSWDDIEDLLKGDEDEVPSDPNIDALFTVEEEEWLFSMKEEDQQGGEITSDGRFKMLPPKRQHPGSPFAGPGETILQKPDKPPGWEKGVISSERRHGKIEKTLKNPGFKSLEKSAPLSSTRSLHPSFIIFICQQSR